MDYVCKKKEKKNFFKTLKVLQYNTQVLYNMYYVFIPIIKSIYS